VLILKSFCSPTRMGDRSTTPTGVVVLEPAVEAAGMAGLNFHVLRRTNATAMVAEGVDVKTAQGRLVHSEPRLTLAICAQATTEDDSRTNWRFTSMDGVRQ